MAAGILAVTADGSLPTVLFATGVVLFVAGFVTVYAGSRPWGRVVGFAVLSAGAVVIVAAAGPAGSWAAAGTVGFTLVPLLAFAAVLARRLEAGPGARASLDDEPR